MYWQREKQIWADATCTDVINRGFPKVDHLGIDARIILEQNNLSKKTTSDRTWTPDPRTVYGAHFFHSCLTPLLVPIDWKTETLMILI